MEERYLNALKVIHQSLSGTDIDWAITGSMGMALQGMDIPVNDIDLQTDRRGAYAMEEHLTSYVQKPVHFWESERIRSHFGALEVSGIQVEIMGDFQKRLENDTWEEPVHIVDYRHWIDFHGMQLPVLSPEYEMRAYQQIGRHEKADAIARWLEETRNG